MDYTNQVESSNKGNSGRPRTWFNGSLTDQEIESLEEVIEEIQKQNKGQEARVQHQATMEDETLKSQDQSQIMQQQGEEIASIKAAMEEMREMMLKMFKEKEQTKPQEVPLPPTPQTQARFEAPPPMDSQQHIRFATSTPFTNLPAGGIPETPYPQTEYQNSSA